VRARDSRQSLAPTSGKEGQLDGENEAEHIVRLRLKRELNPEEKGEG